MPRNVTPNGRGLGCNPDLKDARDYLYAAPAKVLAKLPAKEDLRPDMPPVWDQGALGSCTSFGIAAIVEYAQKRQGFQAFEPSHLALYWMERDIEGTVNADSGAMIRDGIKVVVTEGVCKESSWPYDISKYTQKPPQQCFDEAKKYEATKYARVSRTVAQMQGTVAAGYPIVFGVTLYQSFESKAVERTGVVPMPDTRREQMLGGHCMAIVGYDDTKRWFIVRNSWGESFGDSGYVYMPYLYFTPKLCSDMWQIDLMSD